MDAKLQPCGKQGVLGAKCASKRGCPKERLRGRTMLRKAPLASPKTVAGLFLVAFESPIFASTDRGHSRFSTWPGTLAQNHMIQSQALVSPLSPREPKCYRRKPG